MELNEENKNEFKELTLKIDMNLQHAGFSSSKLKIMLYAKHNTTKSKYCRVNNNKMYCPIIFIFKEQPHTQFIDKLMV